MNKEVAIVLVNYNGYDDTVNCIKSIRKNEKNLDYDIIVVDNKSTDQSVEYLRKIKDIILIEAENNGGFAMGNNIGIKYALDKKYEYVLLLNNDTEIEKNAVSVMLKAIKKDKDVGIVGSRIMYYKDRNKINYYGGHTNFSVCLTYHHHLNKQYFPQMEKKYFYTQFITGCSMMIKKEVFEKVGLLPEDYFMYCEDVDFCIHALDSGYKLGVCSDSIIYHKVSASTGGQSSPFSVKWCTRNRLIFMRKYRKRTIPFFTKFFFYSTRIFVGIIYIITGKFSLLKAMIEGIKEGRKIKI